MLSFRNTTRFFSTVSNQTRSVRWASTLRFTKDHEWIKVDGQVGTMGITQYAADKLGDVVYVDLPKEGLQVKQKQTLCAVESVKAASDVYSPMSGTVSEVNTKLTTEPSTVNKSPLGDGWMVKLKISNPKDLDSLLDEKAYKKHCEESDH